MRPEPKHFYEVAEGGEPGTWGVYCSQCSETSVEYVYPCQWDVDTDDRLIPTVRLFTPEKVQDMLNEVLADMVKDGKAVLAPPGYILVNGAGGWRLEDEGYPDRLRALNAKAREPR